MLTLQQFEEQVLRFFPNEINPLFSSTPTKETVLHVCNFGNLKVKYIAKLEYPWSVTNERTLAGVGKTLEEAIQDYESSERGTLMVNHDPKASFDKF